MLLKRGRIWHYKFMFRGMPVRESSHSTSKVVAREAEQARRRGLELAINHIPKRERVPMFPMAAQAWFGTKANLAEKSRTRYEQCVDALKREFSDRLVCDIGDREIAEYQQKRLSEGLSNRSVNYEIGALRGILKQHGLWGLIADKVKPLKEQNQVGRAISREDETMLVAAMQNSRSPALLPLFVFSVDTGLRASEVRALRRSDLNLEWRDGIIGQGEVVVPKSKTEGGTGRLVPFTQRVCATLTLWLSQFPESGPDHYVFPHHKVGMAGDSRERKMWDVQLDKPAREWKSAWARACRVSSVRYRWHDCRHTFISRLAENPNVSEETLRALAGHVSKKMLERYSHIRSHAKRLAIASLNQEAVNPQATALETPKFGETGHKIGHNQQGVIC
ncbi:MAG: tyrosine-type recombinase/integrase [Terriglobia bacterium]